MSVVVVDADADTDADADAAVVFGFLVTEPQRYNSDPERCVDTGTVLRFL